MAILVNDLSILESGKRKDAYIRRDGDDIILTLASNRAMETMMQYEHLARHFDRLWKPIEPRAVNTVIIWLLSHGLTFESDIPFDVNGNGTEYNEHIEF